MSMTVFLNANNNPIGYTVPPFPSLHWPGHEDRAMDERLYLIFSSDVRRFTILWTLAIFGGVHLVAGLLAVASSYYSSIMHRARALKLSAAGCAVIIIAYTVLGLVKGALVGAVVGVCLTAVYTAGSLDMSTWIPFTLAVALILFDICGAYLTTLLVL